MTHLLDVNVLIALIDSAHVHHALAHDWFGDLRGRAWATCPITENGVVRIVSSRSYSAQASAPAVVAESLASLCAQPGHAFWRDEISLLDRSLVDLSRVGTSAQVTDTYLLALAVSKRGTLATLDRRLSPDAVRGGAQTLHIIT